ncbi:MAG: hypothetical protein JRD93_21335 [Deltaproteobacteria bacterium]|nr:hypothetical protein [Deltaproteobacteria bacterium]
MTAGSNNSIYKFIIPLPAIALTQSQRFDAYNIMAKESRDFEVNTSAIALTQSQRFDAYNIMAKESRDFEVNTFR